MIQNRYIRNVDKWLRDSELKIIQKYITPWSSILDIWCGTGRTTIALDKLWYQMTGIDITPEMIQNAQKIVAQRDLSINYEVGDATQLSYADNSIDNILFLTNGWTQIPWSQNRHNALKEIYRTLKPGWIFILIFHARYPQDKSLFWAKQRIKHNIIKTIWIPIRELDIWDLFFNREIDTEKIDQQQFMHISDENIVKQDLKKIWFKLLFYGRENEIVLENLNDQDNVYNYPPMFAVCKK